MRALLFAIVAALLTNCVTTGVKQQSSTSIGPYNTFDGRLIVIEPKRRWQVTVQWNGTPDEGTVRLIHAATQRIVELRWQSELMQLRDNQQMPQKWQNISREQLASHGIILPPQQLAEILAGQMPSALIEKNRGEWEGRIHGSFVKVKWLASNHRLEIMDISNGRQATLIIQP